MRKWLSIFLAAMLLAVPALCAAEQVLTPEGKEVSNSWAQINQTIGRPENWQQYVQDSAFTLSESMPMEDYPGYSLVQYGTYPTIDGSTVCVPMGMELARQHLGLAESDLPGFVTFSTTHNAYVRLMEGKPNPNVSIASQNAILDPEAPVRLFLGTEPSQEELQMAKDSGVELVKVPFCYDAFVFLVNGTNPVDNLSVKEIRMIYSGEIIQWDKVGGKEGEMIFAYQRPQNSGSQTAMENLVMQGIPLAAAQPSMVTSGMGELVHQIGDYDNGPRALGYSYLYYVDGMYKSGDVKVISVDGVAPTEENLRSGQYPFTTCYYAVYVKGDTETEKFVQWLTSEEGQKCVRQAGYIPVMDVE